MRRFSELKSARAVVLKLKRVFEPEASRLARQEPVRDKAYDDACDECNSRYLPPLLKHVMASAIRLMTCVWM